MPDELTDQERHFEGEITRLEKRIEELEQNVDHGNQQREAQAKLLKAICNIVAHENVKVQSMAIVYKESAAVMLPALEGLE